MGACTGTSKEKVTAIKSKDADAPQVKPIEPKQAVKKPDQPKVNGDRLPAQSDNLQPQIEPRALKESNLNVENGVGASNASQEESKVKDITQMVQEEQSQGQLAGGNDQQKSRKSDADSVGIASRVDYNLKSIAQQQNIESVEGKGQAVEESNQVSSQVVDENKLEVDADDRKNQSHIVVQVEKLEKNKLSRFADEENRKYPSHVQSKQQEDIHSQNKMEQSSHSPQIIVQPSSKGNGMAEVSFGKVVPSDIDINFQAQNEKNPDLDVNSSFKGSTKVISKIPSSQILGSGLQLNQYEEAPEIPREETDCDLGLHGLRSSQMRVQMTVQF